MESRAVRRVALALVLSFTSIYLLSLIKSGPSAAADFDCTQAQGKTRVNIEIAAGETGSQIAQELFDKGVTKSIDSFFRLAVSDPRSAKIAPGVHQIDEEICAADALEQLLDNARIQGLIPIIEGMWNREISELFQKAGYTKDEVRSAFAEIKPPIPFTSLEGLLFPAQYSFAKETPMSEALAQIVNRGVAETTKAGLIAGYQKFSPQELITIASIIQAEGDTQDFSKVSRVIYNRLAIGMPLQMDSTVHYVTGSRGNIFLSTKSTLIKSPYNTYKNYGLPPGPIGNPGRGALVAAVNPAKGNWLYFITVAPGETRFTDNLPEFNRWKVLYKNNLRAGKFGDK